MGRPLLNDAYLRTDGTFGRHGAALLWRKLTATASNATESSVSHRSALAEPEGSTIAAVSQRLPLDLVGVRGKSSVPAAVVENAADNRVAIISGDGALADFLSKQVSLHLRTQLPVTRGSWDILTSTPSEPLLRYAVLDDRSPTF